MKLDNYITLDEAAVKSSNLCDRFSEADLTAIGKVVLEGYQRDKASRSKWERRTQAAMDLAMQVQKDKTFPWAGASNICFPLVTIAAMQFHSRAYPALISGTDVAKMRVIGVDPTGEKTDRAERIAVHMSWQLLEEDQAWEAGQDRLLLNLGLVGTVFKKTYHNAAKDIITGDVVNAQDLVFDYWAKSLESCPRKTHVIPLFRNDVYSRIKRKVFRDVSEEGWYKQPTNPVPDMAQSRADNRAGVTIPLPDETTPFRTLEQHVELDLDDDGYAEPYIITIEEISGCVLRIVTGFDQLSDILRNEDGDIVEIIKLQYFNAYIFIPSPDGSLMGVGFGILLGPLNESVNSLINMLVDAGTMSVTAGGFLGKGAKVRGGVYTFQPLEWKRVDASGDDLRKSIVPLEVREPNQVLFALLSLLIGYVNRVSGTTDPMVGENPGQNTPAENMRTMVAEGSKIYSALFKRVWRAMKDEFKIRYILNGIYLPISRRFGFNDQSVVLKEDYLGNPDDVVPAADPNITSDNMKLTQVQFLAQRAATVPGYDTDAVERRLLKTMHVDGIERIFPGVQVTGAPKDIKIQLQEMKNQAAAAELEAEQMRFVATLQEEMRMNEAEIAKIAAEIQNMQAVTEGDKADRQVAIMQSVMKLLGDRNKAALSKLDIVKKQLEIKREQAKTQIDAGRMGGLEGTSRNAAASASAGG